MRRRIIIATALGAIGLLALSACSAGGGGGGGKDSRGDITIWYSNNEAEIAWGKQMVEAWNADHPDEQIKAQEIPAGESSEAVIGAAITAGNAPCLVYNTSPAAVPGFEKQGGLVNLSEFEDGDDYITERTRRRRRPVPLERRRLLPDAVEVEPRDDLLQQGHVRPGRPRPREPAAGHVRRVPRRRRARSCRRVSRSTRSTRRRRASSSRAGSTSTRSTRRSRAARSCVEDGKATFNDENGEAVADFWATIYAEGLAGNEAYNGDCVRRRAARRCRSWGRGRSRSTARTSTGARCPCRRRTAWTRRRPTPSATPRTSACSPRARTRPPPGTC